MSVPESQVLPTPAAPKVDLSALPPVDVSRLEQDRSRTFQEWQTRQRQHDKQVQATLGAEEREVAPKEAALAGAEKDLAALKAPTPTEKPEWKPHPIVDPKEFQGFSMAILGMALVGGAISRGNWLGVSSSLNGALKGYLDGSREKADREFQDYKTRFDAALQRDKEQQKEFEDVLRSKNLSINSMLREVSNLANKYHREDMRMEAEQRSIDGLGRQLDAMDRSIAQIEAQHERLSVTLGLGLKRLDMGGQAFEHLNPYGQWFIEQRTLGGDKSAMAELEKRYGGVAAAEMANQMGKLFAESGRDPREMTQEQLNNQVQLVVQKQASLRIAGVERLTSVVQSVESRVRDLTQKVNGAGLTTVNATFNRIAKEVGSEDLSELQILLGSMGRLYMEAVTQPGSNAALRVTAQQWADDHFDPNMNIANLEGTLKGMNFEIASSAQFYRKQLEGSRQEVTGQGITLPVPGQTTPPAPQPPVPGATPVP